MPLTDKGFLLHGHLGTVMGNGYDNATMPRFTYGITTDYTLNGKLITHMTCGDNELHFFYDVQKRAAMVKYNNDDYFYVYDMQGNVVALITSLDKGTQPFVVCDG